MADLSVINIADLNKKILEIQRSTDNGDTPAEIRGEGVVLLKNFSQGTTASGKPKFIGTNENIEEAKFNVLNNTGAYEYFEQLLPDSKPHPVWINYSLSKYGLVINNIMAVDGYNPEDFIFHKYNRKEISSSFVTSIKASGISDNAIAIIRAVLHTDVCDAVSIRLIYEYAAYSHHDNCATGLLAHMTKCIRLYNGIKGSYNFLSDQRTNDLMVISLALHDIGKIYEMHDGVYQRYSFLTHRGLGLEHLMPFKKMIVDLYDEEFFYMICSVLLQHHGEYGENPRTIYAMLVHMIDDMEAHLTSIDDIIADHAYSSDASGTKIKYNGSYLNILG